jgi:hypothetical protein
VGCRFWRRSGRSEGFVQRKTTKATDCRELRVSRKVVRKVLFRIFEAAVSVTKSNGAVRRYARVWQRDRIASAPCPTSPIQEGSLTGSMATDAVLR